VALVPPSEAGLKQDDEAADPVYDFFSLTARDLNGVDVRLGDIVSNRLTVILFLRQYGWYALWYTKILLVIDMDLSVSL
jgi:hypothetical protein